MIVYFSADSESLASTPTHEIEHLINELLRSSCHGYHYVIFAREAAKWALEHIHLQPYFEEKLRNIYQSISTRSSVIKLAQTYLNVTIGDVNLSKDSEGVYHIGHRALSRTDFLNESYLAVENSQTDGDLFKEIFNAFCGRHEVRTVRYDLRMGGGSTLDVVVDQCLQRQRITVAICDSDKAYPQASDSDLLSNMIRNANRNNYIGYINSLPCRDIENIIPIDIIFDNRLRPDYNLLFQNILQRIHSDTSLNKTMDWPILYFDMKRGISLARLATLSPLSPEFTWTHENFSLDGTNRLDRDFAGFGPAILADFLSNAKAVSQLANRVRKREWHPKLEELFDILCWYLAGERFQPAI